MHSTLTTTNGNPTVSPAIYAAAARGTVSKITAPHLAAAVANAIEALDHLIGLASAPKRPFPKIRPLAELLAERGLSLDDDFEIAADLDDHDPAEWPAWTETDDGRWTTTEPTPIECLAADWSLPPIAGGAPWSPSEQDWQDMHDATDDRDWYREIDARAAGLPI